MSASDYCSVCWEEFHDDDTGGYNPSCRCGLMCRDCCKTRCDQEEPGAPMPDAPEPKTIDLMKVLTDSLARREDAAGERLAQIAARLNAATPGPWEHCHEIKSLGYIAILGQSQDNQQHYVRSTGGGVVDDGARHDAEFIAHSRSDMEYLLAALSTTEREREALHQQLGSAIDVARETMTEITVGRIASIGSIGNTYCPQIRVSRIEQLHERLVALADSYRARVPSGGEEGR